MGESGSTSLSVATNESMASGGALGRVAFLSSARAAACAHARTHSAPCSARPTSFALACSVYVLCCVRGSSFRLPIRAPPRVSICGCRALNARAPEAFSDVSIGRRRATGIAYVATEAEREPAHKSGIILKQLRG